MRLVHDVKTTPQLANFLNQQGEDHAGAPAPGGGTTTTRGEQQQVPKDHSPPPSRQLSREVSRDSFLDPSLVDPESRVPSRRSSRKLSRDLSHLRVPSSEEHPVFGRMVFVGDASLTHRKRSGENGAAPHFNNHAISEESKDSDGSASSANKSSTSSARRAQHSDKAAALPGADSLPILVSESSGDSGQEPREEHSQPVVFGAARRGERRSSTDAGPPPARRMSFEAFQQRRRSVDLAGAGRGAGLRRTSTNLNLGMLQAIQERKRQLDEAGGGENPLWET